MTLVPGAVSSNEPPDHRAVLCRDTDDLVDVAEQHLRAALGSDDRADGVGGRTRRVAAALRPRVEDAVRERLGPLVREVTFLPPPGDGVGPPGVSVQAYLDGLPPAARDHCRLIGDVGSDYAENDPYGTACLEKEGLDIGIGGVLVGRHTCLYERTDPRLVAIARLTHPVLEIHGRQHVNRAYRTPGQLRAEHPALAEHDRDALVVEVTPHTDTGLRTWIAERARERGLTDPGHRDQLVLAVHEALRTGAETLGARALPTNDAAAARAPVTRLYLRGTDRFCCDVDSTWLPTLRRHELPTDRRLRGLWLALHSGPDVSITIHPLDHHRARIRIEATGVGLEPGAAGGPGG